MESIDEHKINNVALTQYNPVPISLVVLRQIGFSNDRKADELEMTILKFTVDDNPNYQLRAKKENGINRYAVSLYLGGHQLWPWINTVHNLQNYFNIQNRQELNLAFET